MVLESKKEIIENLRNRREVECFPIINRGKLWYDYLTAEQRIELSRWYDAWLDVTETLEIPVRPYWLNDKLEKEELI